MMISSSQPTKSQLLGIAAMTATVAIAGYAYWSHNSQPQTQFSPSIWTEIYRSMVYSKKEQEVLLKFDQFNHAAQLLQTELEEAGEKMKIFSQQGTGGMQHNKEFQALKKQVLELSCDIDHIFGKLDHMDLSGAANMRAQRKQLVDIFAAKAKSVDHLIQNLQLIEEKS